MDVVTLIMLAVATEEASWWGGLEHFVNVIAVLSAAIALAVAWWTKGRPRFSIKVRLAPVGMQGDFGGRVQLETKVQTDIDVRIRICEASDVQRFTLRFLGAAIVAHPAASMAMESRRNCRRHIADR